MFAHEVANKVKKSIKIFRGMSHHKDVRAEWIGNIYVEIRDELNRAVKFHLGDIDDLAHLTKNDAGKPIFHSAEYFKMPYPVCYFDSTFNEYKSAELPDICVKMGRKDKLDNSKEAVLCVELPLKDKTIPPLLMVHSFTYAEGSGWIINPVSFFAQPGGMVPEVLNFVKAVLHQGGDFQKKAFDPRDDVNKIYTIPFFHMPIERLDDQIALQAEMALNLRMLSHGIMILNCKNIITEDVNPDQKEQKRRKLCGQQEIFTYKVLKIKADKSRQEDREDREATGLHNRVHLCRGHFKEYSEDRPLLGKISGRFWWQPSVRGRNRNGIIVKDYDLEAKGGSAHA